MKYCQRVNIQKGCDDDWPEYKMLILHRIERLETQQNYIEQQVQSTDQDVLALQYKVTSYETLASVIPALIIVIIAYLKFHNKLKEWS